jgi:hypothetical protein
MIPLYQYLMNKVITVIKGVEDSLKILLVFFLVSITYYCTVYLSKDSGLLDSWVPGFLSVRTVHLLTAEYCKVPEKFFC